LKSKVLPSRSIVTTAMAVQQYYDEEGRLHRHDANSATTGGRCSEGHRYKQVLRRNCGVCDWVIEGSIEWSEK
jgi:hypothetical protein